LLQTQQHSFKKNYAKVFGAANNTQLVQQFYCYLQASFITRYFYKEIFLPGLSYSGIACCVALLYLLERSAAGG